MKLSPSAGLAAGLLLLAAAPAAAAPVTVSLRIEGRTATLFEGTVITDVRPFHFTGDASHTCDGRAPAGSSATPQPTRGAAVTAAEETAGLVAHGTWSDQFGSPTFTDVGGEDVSYDAGSGRYLAEFQNGAAAQRGSCGDPIAGGDRVVYAFATGMERVLALSGPATARPGEPVTLRVTDDATGAPVAGAAVAGKVSGADGTVLAGPWGDRGRHDLKASADGAIRSNRVSVCVTDGADGACGTTTPATKPAVPAAPDRTPPAGRLFGLRDHQSLKRGPRVLRGSFAADPSGLKTVKLRLTRRVGHRCWYFSGRRERFRRTKCGTGAYFAIGDRADWTYLLPSRLRAGRYVLDAVAIDGAGNRTPLARGTSRVVFRVR